MQSNIKNFNIKAESYPQAVDNSVDNLWKTCGKVEFCVYKSYFDTN